MEHLSVKNFSVIKEADFDVGKINLIIGQQATGKSVIAKLLYFFRYFMSRNYIVSIQNLEDKKQLEREGIKDFENFFPKYTWVGQEFAIVYNINDFEVSVVRKKNKNGSLSTRLDYSKNLVSLHRKMKSAYKKKMDAYRSEKNLSFAPLPSKYQILGETFKEFIGESSPIFGIAPLFSPTFIPASRSFFATFQKQPFSISANNITIDHFVRFFGYGYERVKTLYEEVRLDKYEKEKQILVDKIADLMDSVLAGKYSFKKEQDWIVNESRKINIANASSGQQEALPMLIMLFMEVFLSKNTIFIEEPEAHLFPVSQKHILSIIGLLYKKKSHNFVITTHSPYVLTAINNMILTNDVANKNKEAAEKITDIDCSIKYEDVRAYTIEDGVLKSILDDELRMIGPSVIDSVSDEFDKVYDALLEIQYEK